MGAKAQCRSEPLGSQTTLAAGQEEVEDEGEPRTGRLNRNVPHKRAVGKNTRQDSPKRFGWELSIARCDRIV